MIEHLLNLLNHIRLTEPTSQLVPALQEEGAIGVAPGLLLLHLVHLLLLLALLQHVLEYGQPAGELLPIGGEEECLAASATTSPPARNALVILIPRIPQQPQLSCLDFVESFQCLNIFLVVNAFVVFHNFCGWLEAVQSFTLMVHQGHEWVLPSKYLEPEETGETRTLQG